MSFRSAALADVCEINPRLPSLRDDEVVAFLPMAAVSEDGQIAFEEERSVHDVRKGYTYFERGDVLVAKITPCFENGKATRTTSLQKPVGFGSTEFHVLRAGHEVDPAYLFHLVWNSRFRELGANNMTGSAGQKRVPVEFLKRLRIPLPPLNEQRRIATILDKADALRRKRKRALDLLDSLTQSIFLEMFGDPVSNSMSWPTKLVGEVSKVVTGNTPSRQNKSYYGSAIEWIKSDNIDPSNLFLSEASERLSNLGKSVARLAPLGATLVTCIAGSPNSIGNAAMTNREVAFNQQINALIPESLEPFFLHFHIKVGKRLVQDASTGGMKGLVSKSRLESVRVICPPDRNQREFARRARKVEAAKTGGRAGMSISEALFASLQYRAFSGQL